MNKISSLMVVEKVENVVIPAKPVLDLIGELEYITPKMTWFPL